MRVYLEVSYQCHSKATDRENHQTTNVQPRFVHQGFQLKVSEDGDNEPWNREKNNGKNEQKLTIIIGFGLLCDLVRKIKKIVSLIL